MQNFVSGQNGQFHRFFVGSAPCKDPRSATVASDFVDGQANSLTLRFGVSGALWSRLLPAVPAEAIWLLLTQGPCNFHRLFCTCPGSCGITVQWGSERVSPTSPTKTVGKWKSFTMDMSCSWSLLTIWGRFWSCLKIDSEWEHSNVWPLTSSHTLQCCFLAVVRNVILPRLPCGLLEESHHLDPYYGIMSAQCTLSIRRKIRLSYSVKVVVERKSLAFSEYMC